MRQPRPSGCVIAAGTGRGLYFNDESHALQAAVAGHGAVIASQLLVGDLVNRGVLVAPFADSLPGANYYMMTLEDKADVTEIRALRQWLLQMMP